MKPRMTVARVYKITEGSALAADITSGSPATGGNLGVEAVTDFDIPTDGETRTVVIDSEQITYTGVNEDTDELTGITRGANSTTAAFHTGGAFVQYGTVAKKHKLADGFIDDDDSMAIGVEILRHLWRFYPVGGRDNDQMEIASVEFLDDGHPIIVDAPEDEDKATTPVVLPFTKSGPLATGTRPAGHPMPFGGSIEEVRARVNTAPTGASLIIDVLVDGVSILTTKPTITAGSTLSALIEPTDKFHTKGQIVQVEIEQVGSTVPGSDLTVYVTVFPSEDAVAGRIEIEGPQGPTGAAGADGADGIISEVQNEGSALADQSIMNFTGSGVDVTVAGGKYVVDIPGGAGGGAATEIASTRLGSSAASITFSSIPSSYKHLLIVFSGKTTDSAAQNVLMRFNSDTGNNYHWVLLSGSGGSASSGNSASGSSIIPASVLGSSHTSRAASYNILIPEYTQTNFHKNSISHGGRIADDTATNHIIQSFYGHWKDTSAITSITLLPGAGNFDVGTIATLYGLS